MLQKSMLSSLLLAAFVVLFILLAVPSTRVSADPAVTDAWVAPARATRKANPIAADAKSIAAGKALFTKQCFSCHGEAGKGDGPAAANLTKKPGNLSDPKLATQADGALFWKITEGRTPMPTFEKLLTEEERWNVINFVRTLAPKK